MRVFLAVSGLLEAFARDSNGNELDQENVHRSQFQTKQTSLQNHATYSLIFIEHLQSYNSERKATSRSSPVKGQKTTQAL